MQKIARDGLEQQYVETINGLAPDSEGNLVISTGAATPSIAEYVYDPLTGRINSITETIEGQNRVTTMSYDTEGNISSTVIVYKGVTQTSTYTRSNGKVTSIQTVTS